MEIRKTGLGEKNEKRRFAGGRNEGSAISAHGSETIEIETIDDVLEGKVVGFIKMDIEGAEREALEGARFTISMQHPVLAVSVYHKRNDIWELPAQIINMNPNYKLYLRHYTVSYGDTVLYAVDK